MTWSVAASSAGVAYAASTVTTILHSTGPNTFVFSIDMSNMTSGDLFSIRLFTCCGTSATTTPHQVWKGTWQNIQTNPVKLSPPVASSGLDFSATFESVSGSTTETFPWQLLSI